MESYQYSLFGSPTVCQAAGTDGKWLTSDDVPRQIPIESGYGNPYMFTARNWEGGIGLYYYRARFYSPQLGRFLQPDPIGYYDSMNLYQYCLNSPVNWIDPFGLKCEKNNGGWIKDIVDWIKSWIGYAPPSPIGEIGAVGELAGDGYDMMDKWNKRNKEWNKAVGDLPIGGMPGGDIPIYDPKKKVK